MIQPKVAEFALNNNHSFIPILVSYKTMA